MYYGIAKGQLAAKNKGGLRTSNSSIVKDAIQPDQVEGRANTSCW
jgi:hypothetical protein